MEASALRMPKLPPHSASVKAVVPVVVLPGGDVPQAVDLGGHVVVDEKGAAMPGQQRRVDRGRGEVQVLLALDPLGGAEGDDLARGVARPFVGGAVVVDAQVVDLALLDQADGFQHGLGGHGVEGAHFVVLAPDPSPAPALLPALQLVVRLAGRGPGSPSQQQGACHEQARQPTCRCGCVSHPLLPEVYGSTETEIFCPENLSERRAYFKGEGRDGASGRGAVAAFAARRLSCPFSMGLRPRLSAVAASAATGTPGRVAGRGASGELGGLALRGGCCRRLRGSTHTLNLSMG